MRGINLIKKFNYFKTFTSLSYKPVLFFFKISLIHQNENLIKKTHGTKKIFLILFKKENIFINHFKKGKILVEINYITFLLHILEFFQLKQTIKNDLTLVRLFKKK